MSLEKLNYLEIARLKRKTTEGVKGMELKSSANVKTNTRTYCIRSDVRYQTILKVNALTFVIIRILYSNVQTETEATATAIKLDPITGAIATVGTPQQLWVNTSYGASSTTQFVTSDGSGKFFAFGYNVYPTGTYSYGYFWGSFDDDGNKLVGGVSKNNDYHGTTGQWSGVMNEAGTGYNALLSSYSASDGKSRYIRLDFTGENPNLQVIRPAYYTSTQFATKFVSQKGVASASVAGVCQYLQSSTSCKTRVVGADGAYTDYPRPRYAMGKESIGFILSNGKALVLDEREGNYVYSSHGVRQKVNGFPAKVVYSEDVATQITNVGVDTWVTFDREAGTLTSFHINPNTCELTILDTKAIPLNNATDTFVKIYGNKNQFALVVPRQLGNYTDVITYRHNLKLGA